MSHDDRLARVEASLRRIERRQIRAERHLRWLRVLGLASLGRSEEILVLLRTLTPSDPLAVASVETHVGSPVEER
jgi:hypothetical protein